MAEIRKGAQVGILEHVLGLAVIAQDGAGDPVEALVEAPHHGREERCLAGTHALDQQGDRLVRWNRALACRRFHRARLWIIVRHGIRVLAPGKVTRAVLGALGAA